MFNSDNFSEINYLNFDSEFNINLESKIKVILAPNGTGKTSIYKNIKSRFPNYSFIDYNEVEQSVISKKDEVVIGASIVLIDSKKSEKNKLLEKIDVKGNLKNFNITNPKTAKAISDNLDILRKDSEKAVASFTNEKLECIFSMSDDDRVFFNENARKLLDIEEIKTKIEDIKNNYKKHFLEEIDNYLENDDYICPVCGQESSEPIKGIIEKKLLEIKEINEEIINKYQISHPNLKPSEILENVNEIKSIIAENKLTIEDLESYFICGGDQQKSNLIKESKKILYDINNDINTLEIQKDRFYENLKKYKDNLSSTFQLQFSVNSENIVFDDLNKLIRIKLPRKIEEYSTGEINLMTFMICLLEYISSDKEYLVIDDPLSSYDIPNQYKIMYEIASAKNDLKGILIFTHNIDTINIANTQYNKIFEFEIMEKRKKTLYLNKINYSCNTNILSPTELIKNLSETYLHLDYLKLLMEKEVWEEDSENHLIFHYDEPFSKELNGIHYSNDYLINLIDNFDENTFQNISYLENTANKIIYTAALRIWIEKQFFIESNNDPGLHKKQFGDKIKYIFSSNRWNGSNEVTREYLMSKKVMLNQHIHQQSQIMPFYYSLNLTFDDISNEINDIKKRFLPPDKNDSDLIEEKEAVLV